MDELRLSSLRSALEEDTASQAVLHSLHKPLLRRFAQICGSPSREGLPLDGGLDARMTRVPVAEMTLGETKVGGVDVAVLLMLVRSTATSPKSLNLVGVN